LNKKRQHTIPECYLKAFVDPYTPADQEPYVWIMDRLTKTCKRKSIKKVFTENNFYTVNLSSGKRNLIIEDTLASIEDKYARILRNTLLKKKRMTENEKAYFALFVSALWSRTISQKMHWEKQLEQLASVTETIERHHGIEPKKSKEIREYIPESHKHRLIDTLELGANILLTKSFSFLVADGNSEFITSDDPVSFRNPVTSGTFWGAAPIDPRTDFLLPLTPRLAFFAVGGQDEGFIAIPNETVLTCNHRTAAFSCEYVISSKKEPDFFDGKLFRDPRLEKKSK